MTQRSGTGVKIFAFGVATGLIFTTLVVGIGAFILLQKGVIISLDRATMIDQLTVQAGLTLRTAIPEMLVQAREQLPRTVKERVSSGLGEMSLEIASYQIRLPPVVVNRIDDYLQSTVTAVFAELLNGLESSAYQAITDEQLRLQASKWAESLQGMRFPVEVAWRITIPVTLRLD